MRTSSPTDLYHVTSRAIRPLKLFVDATDCAAFLHGLAVMQSNDPWRVYAYCLMGTHFDCIVRAELDLLGRAMRRLKGWYAHELNARRGRTGPAFDDRCHASAIATEAHAFAAVVYVELNPVRAVLCAHPSTWPFSGYRAHAALEPSPGWLASLDGLGLPGDAKTDSEAVEHAMQQSMASGSGRKARPKARGSGFPI